MVFGDNNQILNSEEMVMKQGILFDLDGTLWNSSLQVVESWNEILTTLPDVNFRVTEESIQSVMGLQMDEIGRRFFQGLPEFRVKEIMQSCMKHENEYLRTHGGVLFPHLEEVLEQLSKDYFLAIVSNCQVGYIEAFLEYHKLGNYFQDFENFGATGMSKGDNIRLVCQRNDLDKAVYLGDIQGDYDSACKAGVPFILAGYGFGSVDAEVPVIQSLLELPTVAEKILNQM